MKKCLSLLFVSIMLLGLCACGEKAAEPAKEAVFQAGFGRVNITPSYSVPLAGYGNTQNRMSTGFKDYLYATCIAIKDADGEQVLLVTIDLITMSDALCLHLRDAVTKATGMPGERIMLCTTHTHSGPDIGSQLPIIDTFWADLARNVSTACQQALEDLSPVTLQTGSVDVEGLSFVRHYVMNDGTYAGDNFGSWSSGIAGHEREPDKQMQLVRFCRDDKKDILMVNWQVHSKVSSGGGTHEAKLSHNLLSADYIGTMREYMEKQDSDLQIAYFLGGAGNLNPQSQIDSEMDNVPVMVVEYGEALSKFVQQGLENMTEVKTGPVVVKQTIFEAQRDHTEDHLRYQAQEVYDLWRKTGSNSAAFEAGKPYGIASPYHAASILARANTSSQSKEMELNAVVFGDVAFVAAPYEMFCQNGQAIKEGSPYGTTIVSSCSNGHNNYIAADAAFEYGSYEVHNRYFVRGTAEALADEFVSMLTEIKG